MKIFKAKKSGQDSIDLVAAYNKLVQDLPPQKENFLDTLSYLLKIINAKSGAIFLFEEKAQIFLLKKWEGSKPTRFAISQDYELLKYMRVRKAPLVKEEFVKSSHDLRQPILFFFQQMSATHIIPIFLGEECPGFVTMNLEGLSSAQCEEALTLIKLYARDILYWSSFQNVFQENQKLSEVSHVKNQLLANVSHELRTPLNGILGFSEALQDGSLGELTEEAKEAVLQIHKSGKALNQTLNDFLSLAQIEARKSEIKHEKANMCDLISEVVMLFHDSFEKRDIKLSFPDLEKPIYVFGEPDQIRTVLMNLLSNASKFTEKGEIRLSTKRSGEMLHVSVSDTGIGVDQSKLDLIFEEFYQGDGSHTRVYGGTGLGLAIAKKIVALHGGRIWAMPNGHQGTSFTFTVPLCPGV